MLRKIMKYSIKSMRFIVSMWLMFKKDITKKKLKSFNNKNKKPLN